ncbi:hypothetical protein [Halorubrum cibi]|nr:hypothetical protein [Halorubrum cibi]
MTVSADEVDEYIDELDSLAEDVIENTESFFESMEAEHNTGKNGLYIGGWQTPTTDQKESQREILETYHEWYASSRVLVKEYMETELEDFERLRDNFDELIRLQISPDSISGMGVYSTIHDVIVTQRGIVNAIPRKISAERFKVKEQISKSVAKDEVKRARDLLQEGLPRASGVTAGVSLERHLLTMCQETDVKLEYNYDDGIRKLADTLYKSDVIEQTTLSSLKTLSSIRNDCAHANQTAPNEHKVKRLIEDTDDYIRGRGI